MDLTNLVLEHLLYVLHKVLVKGQQCGRDTLIAPCLLEELKLIDIILFHVILIIHGYRILCSLFNTSPQHQSRQKASLKGKKRNLTNFFFSSRNFWEKKASPDVICLDEVVQDLTSSFKKTENRKWVVKSH